MTGPAPGHGKRKLRLLLGVDQTAEPVCLKQPNRSRPALLFNRVQPGGTPL